MTDVIVSKEQALIGLQSPDALSTVKQFNNKARKELVGRNLEIKKYKESHQGDEGKQTLEALKKNNEISISQQDIDDIKLKMGAGIAKRNNNAIEVDPDKLNAITDMGQKAAAEKNFNDASRLLQQSFDAMIIAKVNAEAQKSGRQPLEVFQSLREISNYTSADYQRMQISAYKAIKETGMMGQLLDGWDKMDSGTQDAVIDAYMLNHPTFAAKVAESMRQTIEDAKTLTSVEKDEEYDKAIKEKKQADADVDANKAVLTGLLKSMSSPMTEPEIEDAIKDILDRGLSLNTAAYVLRQKMLAKDARHLKVIERDEAERNANQLLKQFTELSSKTTPGPALSAVENQYKTALAIYENLRDNVNSWPDKANVENAVNEIISATAIQTDPAGKIVGDIPSKLDGLVSANKLSLDAEKRAKDRETAALQATNASMADRLQKEADVINKLENVVHNAVVDAIIQNHTEIVEIESARRVDQVKAEDDADLQKVVQHMDAWIRNNPNSRIKEVHRDVIGQDVRFLAYHPEDGIKRLMIRDMQLKMKDPAGGTNMVAIPYESVNLDSLPDEAKRKLEIAMEKYGSQYEQTLLKDYFMARNFGWGQQVNPLSVIDLYGSKGDLNLRDHELTALYEKFGSTMEAQLQSAKETQGMITKLKESGMYDKLSSSRKWSLLVALLAIVGVGSALAVGGIPAAAGLIGAGAKSR